MQDRMDRMHGGQDGQDACRTGWTGCMQDRMDRMNAGQDGCRTGQMQMIQTKRKFYHTFEKANIHRLFLASKAKPVVTKFLAKDTLTLACLDLAVVLWSRIKKMCDIIYVCKFS